jgi:hypothetical protein
MKRSEAACSLVAAVLLFAGSSACASPGFTGFFSGYYAPAKWTTFVSGNPLYQNTASVNVSSAPQSIEISGAVDAPQTIRTPEPPASVIDYTIALNGNGLAQVAFSYLFSGLSDGYDAAQLIYDDGSGFQVVANLSTLIGVQQTYSGQLQGPGTFGFRVYSNNDNLADTLIISVVPEPSALTLLGLGSGALWLSLRRRKS